MSNEKSKVFLFNSDDPELRAANEKARANFRYFWRDLGSIPVHYLPRGDSIVIFELSSRFLADIQGTVAPLFRRQPTG